MVSFGASVSGRVLHGMQGSGYGFGSCKGLRVQGLGFVFLVVHPSPTQMASGLDRRYYPGDRGLLNAVC